MSVAAARRVVNSVLTSSL